MSGKAPAGPELWRHCIESSVLAGAGILLLAVLLPPAVHVLLLILCGAVLSACMMYAALATAGSIAIGAWLLAWGIAATSWMAAARIIGPWHEIVITGLIIPVLVLAMLGPVAIGHHRAALDKEEKAREARLNEKALRRWVNLLAGCGVEGAEILEEIEYPGGRQVHGRLGKVTQGGPLPGTIRDLRGATDLIAQHRRLDPGSVTVEEKPDAEFVLHIREKKGTREVVYLPAENQLLTINRELGLAVKDNGREWGLKIREVNVLIAGVTGAGKSNLLQVLIAQLARCVDVVIFVIDLKGGRAARPWMVPWIREFAERPVIDWLATDRTEAALMMDALWAAREDRSRSGAGGEKIIPSKDLPAILLLCDEGAVLLGHGNKDEGISSHKMAKRALQLAETGRSEAINLILAAVRADVETLGNTGYKAMSRVRIGMAVSQESDGRSVFPDDGAAAKALSRITEPGSGIAKVFRDVSPPLQFYRITDGNPLEDGTPTEDRISPVAESTGKIRPALDARTAAAMGEAYAQRWERPHGQALLKEWRQDAGVKPPPAPDDEFGQIVAFNELDPEASVSLGQQKMREILRKRRFQGATTATLLRLLAVEGFNPERETVQRWLAKDEKLGMCRRGGKPHHRWTWVFAADDLSGTG